MNITQVTEYRKHGCYFAGKLVVVDYSTAMSLSTGFGEQATLDAIDIAKKLVVDSGYIVVKPLLHIPEYVVEVA